MCILFVSSEGSFLLDGKPFVFVAGALHYFRVPQQYWRHRLSSMRRAGINTLHTSLEWSSHEPRPGEFRFDGDCDFVAFIKIAHEEGLWTVVRPGPFIGANRDFGGLPAWLLWQSRENEHDLSLFTFKFHLEQYLEKVLRLLQPLLYENGGPVLLVEMQNFLGENSEWILGLAQKTLGSNTHVMMSNIATSHQRISTELSVTNLWDFIFTSSRRMRDNREMVSLATTLGPNGPWLNMNMYIGMPRVWGVESWQDLTTDLIPLLTYYFRLKVSFCLVMFHGGTNFGFSSGALYMPGTGHYAAYTTSNDMMAPLREDGACTGRFHFRRLAEIRYLPLSSAQKPPQPKRTAYGTIVLRPVACLLDDRTLQRLATVKSRKFFPVSFEDLHQSSGFVLYRTVVPLNQTDPVFRAPQVHDSALIYLDKRLMGQIRRPTFGTSLCLQGDIKSDQDLSILVENEGRTSALRLDPLEYFKGLTYNAPVNLGLVNLVDWTMFGIPLDDVEEVQKFVDEFQDEYNGSCAPVFYKGIFVVPKDMVTPADTHLDMTGWTKGVIFVNGHNLGRYWPAMGPQVTLYLPGCFLHPAPTPNKVVVFELLSPHPEGKISSVEEPKLGMAQNENKKVLIAFMLIPFVSITGYWVLNYLNEWIYLK